MKQPVQGIDLSNGIRPGIAGLAKAIMPDLARDGITINLVLPGSFLTSRISPGLGRTPAERAEIEAHSPGSRGDTGRPSRRSDRARASRGLPGFGAGRVYHRRRLPDRRRQHPRERLDVSCAGLCADGDAAARPARTTQIAPNTATTMVNSHSGHVKSQIRKWSVTSSVFWIMKMISTPRPVERGDRPTAHLGARPRPSAVRLTHDDPLLVRRYRMVAHRMAGGSI